MRRNKIISLAGVLCVLTLGQLAATSGTSASTTPKSASSAAKLVAPPFRHLTHSAAVARPGRFVAASGSGAITQLARTPTPVSRGAVASVRVHSTVAGTSVAQPGAPKSGAREILTPAAPTQLNAFAGISQQNALNSFGSDQGVAPPDPNLAVGPDDVIEAANNSLSFYRRDGTLESAVTSTHSSAIPVVPT